MTSTDVAIRSQGTFDLDKVPAFTAYAEEICKTDFVPKGMRGNTGAVLACIMTGQEMGIAPMQSLRQLFVVEGRVGQYAEMMRAMILDAGHDIYPGSGNEFTMTRVVMYGKRSDRDREFSVEWNWDMVVKAGLMGKDNYKKYPRQMMMNRATAELARIWFPDIISGMGYTPEELEDISDGYEPEPEEHKPTTAKRTAPAAKRRRKAAPVQEESPLPPEPDLPGDDDDDIVDAEIVPDEDDQVSPSDEVEKPEDPKPKATASVHSRQVVRLAKALKLDHHGIVSYVTKGRTESSNDLDEEEATKVMDALRAIEEGRARVEKRGDEWFVFAVSSDEAPAPAPEPVVDAEDAEPELPDEEEDDEGFEDWDADQWRAFLAENNVKVTLLIRQMAVIWKGRDGIPPASLQSISGSGIADELAQWVRSQNG